MGREMEACTNCTHDCFLIHQKNRGQVPKVSSFFKVMLGKQFDEVLYLPPKFAKTLKSSAGKIMYLKDSSGQEWGVVLSNGSGSLAFQNGWHEFSSDHSIEVGDFVIFHHIVGSLCFVVQIFGRSGCEKLAFSSEVSYRNKRMKSTRDAFTLQPPNKAFYPNPPAKKNPSAYGVSRPNDDIIEVHDEDENNIHNSPSMAGNIQSPQKIAQGLKGEPATNILEDLSFILGRSMSSPKVVKENLFDLSILEISEKQVSKEVENPDGSVDGKKSHTAEDDTFSKNEEPCLLKTESSLSPSGCPSVDMPPSSSMTKKPVEMPLKSEILAPSGSWDWISTPSIPNHRGIAFGLEDRGPCVEGWWRELSSPGPNPVPRPQPIPSTQSSEIAERTRVVKQEPIESIEDFGSDIMADTSVNIPCHDVSLSTGEPGVIVKCEPIDLFESSPGPVASVTCSVQADESFLELSEPLPIRACRAAISEKKLVTLHDPDGRLWPVVYHRKYGFKVLANGWASFRKANNIQAGDQCTFAVENRDEGIFAVTIHRS